MKKMDFFLGVTCIIGFASYFVYLKPESLKMLTVAFAMIMVVTFVIATIYKIRKLKRINAPIVYKLCGPVEKMELAIYSALMLFVWYVTIVLISYWRIIDVFIKNASFEIKALAAILIFGAVIIYIAVTTKTGKRKT